VGDVKRRLERLERQDGEGRGCPGCGWPPEGYPKDLEVATSFGGSTREPEFCPTCGRRLVVTVRWGDR
jgi:hypothetical protein